MESDSIRIALIAESVNASSRARRLAAQLLLDALRSETALGDPDDFLARIGDEVEEEVVGEARSLIAGLGLAKS